MHIESPYLLFIGDVTDRLDAKTALGLLDWRRERCAGQLRLPGCALDLGIPDMSPAQAVAAGVKTLVIGIAPTGGRLPGSWRQAIAAALNVGLHVANGLHTRLARDPEFAALAEAHGARILDLREPPPNLTVASGRRRPGRRLLAVGTDCACGKKYTALAVHQAMVSRGWRATFRATGQTGILIDGHGIAVDAVVADFVAGAAETLSPANALDHWDVIEGQGSLFHPAYAGVSLGLLHGSQPDALVLCHEHGRERIGDYPDYPVPSLEECAARNLEAARLTNRGVRLAGISVNTAKLAAPERARVLEDLESRMGVPCVDVVIHGAGRIVEHLAGWT